MASLCGKCEGEIVNSDFIKCDGTCGSHYHTKCVSLNKSTLNAVTSCPNICWYCHDCHDCNNKRIDPNYSSPSIKDDMNLMMKSLSDCLLNGFAMMTEKIVDNVSMRIPTHSLHNVNRSPELSKKRRRDDADDDKTNQQVASKKFVYGSNDNNSGLAVANVPLHNLNSNASPQSKEQRKSIVISNIGKSITANHIIDYLANELKIDKASIRVTPLAPAGKSLDDLTYMQYSCFIISENDFCLHMAKRCSSS